VSTSSASNLLVGTIDDPVVGRLNCQTYFQMVLNNGSISIDTTARYDSAILLLDPGYHFGEASGAIRMGVHRLKQGMDPDSTYYVFDELQYDPKPLAEKTFTAEEIQSSELAIRMDELGRTLFEDRNREEFFLDNERFLNYFKGLTLVPKSAENSVVGFLPEDQGNLATTGFYIFYTLIEEDTQSFVYKFPITVENERFNRIQSEPPQPLSRLKTPNLPVNTNETGNLGYIQAGAGLVSRLEFPNVDILRENYNSVIINRAEIRIPSTEMEVPYYQPPGGLFLFKASETNQIIFFEQSAFGEIGTGVRVDNDYIVDLTFYVQELVAGRQETSGYLLLPSLNGSTINQFVYSDQKSNASDQIRLLVYYLPVN
jgi:hypothetical protein